MHKRICVLLAAGVAAACAPEPSGPAPCSADKFCATGSFCNVATGKCAALPANFTVTLSPAEVTVTAGKTIKLDVSSAGGVTWATTDGGTIDADGTFHAPATPGTYHAVATSTADATKSATATINVAPVPLTPVVIADAVVTAGQTGLVARVPSPQVGATISWTITGGTAAPGNTGGPTFTFAAGTGTSLVITCKATNAAGDFAESTTTVAVAPVPVAPTLTAPSKVSKGKAGLLANVTGPLATMTYSWTIAGGTITSATTGASITFSAGALATVTLRCTATNAAGATAASAPLVLQTVDVANATITLAATISRGKPGIVASVPAQSGATYSWSIGAPGTISGGHGTSAVTFTTSGVPDASPSVALSVTVTNAAGDPTSGSANATLVDPPVAVSIAMPANVTQDKPSDYAASFPSPQPGVTYAWAISNGTITSATSGTSIIFRAGASLGSYQLTVTATNLAGDSLDTVLSGNVVAAPVAPTVSFSGSSATEVSQGISYTASITQSSGLTYQWSITGGTITSTVTTGASVDFTPGDPATLSSVTLTATAKNAADDTAAGAKTSTIIGRDATISAAYTQVSQGVGGYTATVAGHFSYLWSITGGTIPGFTNRQTVIFTAGASGSVQLTVTVTNTLGHTDTKSKTFGIVALDPTFTFTPTSISQNKEYSVTGPASYSAYSWSDSTGISVVSGGNAQTLTFTATPTSATLKLTVTNSLGDSRTTSPGTTVTVVPLDATITSPSSVSAGVPASASVPNNANTTFDWSQSTGLAFANGITNTASVSFTATNGSPVLKVTVTNTLVDSVSTTKSLTVVPLDSTITFSNGANGTTVSQNKTYSASVTNNADTTFDWTGSSGVTINGPTNQATVSFKPTATSGVQLKCTVINSLTQSSTGTKVLTVIPLDATITAADKVTLGRTGRPASVATVSGSTYLWTLTNATLDGGESLTNPSIKYTATGANVTVQVTVTNSIADTDSKTLNVTAYPLNATITLGTAPATPTSVTYNKAYSASVPDNRGTGSTYDWSQSTNITITFGTATDPGISFKATGTTATIKMVTQNPAGDTAQQSIALTVVPLDPTVTIAKTNLTRGQTYTASVQPAAGQLYDWVRFTDGVQFISPTDIPNVTFIAAASGSHNLTCEVTNSLGDKDSNTKSLTIYEPPPALFDLEIPGFVLNGGAFPSAAVPSVVDGNVTPWFTLDWSVAGATITGPTAPFREGVAFNGFTGTLTATATNPANDATSITVAFNISSHDTGMMIIAGKTGGPGYSEGAARNARLHTVSMAPDNAGGAYVAHRWCCMPEEYAVFKVSKPSGSPPWQATKLNLPNLGYLQAIATAPGVTDSFFVCENTVKQYSFSGGNWSGTQVFNQGGCTPNGLHAASQTLLFAFRNASLYRIKGDGAGGWLAPEFLAGDPSGNSYGFLDGEGAAARFSFPQGVAGPIGDPDLVWLSESNNNAIREVRRNPSTGIWKVTTIIGNLPPPCTVGCSRAGSQDGSIASALIGYPSHVMAAGSSTLYFAEGYPNGYPPAIRKAELFQNPDGSTGGDVTTVRRFQPSALRSEIEVLYPSALARTTPTTLLVAQQQLGNIVALDLGTGATSLGVGKAATGEFKSSSIGPAPAIRLSGIYGFPVAAPLSPTEVALVGSNGGDFRFLQLAGGIWSQPSSYTGQCAPSCRNINRVAVADLNTMYTLEYVYDGTTQISQVTRTAPGSPWVGTSIATFPTNPYPEISEIAVADVNTIYAISQRYDNALAKWVREVWSVVRSTGTWQAPTVIYPALGQTSLLDGPYTPPLSICATDAIEIFVSQGANYSGGPNFLYRIVNSGTTPSITSVPVGYGGSSTSGAIACRASDPTRIFQADPGAGALLVINRVAGNWSTVNVTTYPRIGVDRFVQPGRLPGGPAPTMRFNVPWGLRLLPGGTAPELYMTDQVEPLVMLIRL